MRRVLIFLIALQLCGCMNATKGYFPKSQMPDSSEVIDVTEALLQPEKSLESTFDALRFIFLETNEQSILSEIYNVVAAGNRIIIRDSYKYGSVAIFDTLGKLIRRLPNGKGPEEIGLADNIFCNDEFLFVSDVKPHKISKFTLDGQFVSSMYINMLLKDFAFINGDLFLLSGPRQNRTGRYMLIETDSIPENYLGWDIGQEKFEFSKENYLQYCCESLYITFPWDENVYCYNEGAVYKKYSFQNGSADVDFSQFSDVLDMFKRLPDGDFVHTGDFWETSDFQFFKYATYRYRIKQVFRDRRTGHVWTNNFTKNSLLNLISIVNVADYESNTFLGVIMPESFSLDEDNPDWRWDGSNPGNLVSEADMEKLRSVKPDDNPIIVLFKLKSDL